MCWVLASCGFCLQAACSLYVLCREFSPCKQAAGNVNLAWHFPAHPPHPTHFCSALGDACSLLHFSLQPHSFISSSKSCHKLLFSPLTPGTFPPAGPTSPDAFAAPLVVPCYPGRVLIHFRVIPFNHASFYGDLRHRELPASHPNVTNKPPSCD